MRRAMPFSSVSAKTSLKQANMQDEHGLLSAKQLKNLFQEPESFVQKPTEYTFTTYTSPQSGYLFRIRLVASSWGHYLWNGAILLADLLSGKFMTCIQLCDWIDVRGKRVLELGAGGGLPSLLASMRGACHVLITEYPEDKLVDNLKWNVTENLSLDTATKIQVDGFRWGDLTMLNEYKTEALRFDVVLLADLISNHFVHDKLLLSCQELLKVDGVVYVLYRLFLIINVLTKAKVAFGHHRPHLIDKDMNFFRLAASSYGLSPKHLLTIRRNPMFPNDPGVSIKHQLTLTVC
eukprot:jgi/Galph1/5779/GphlegSOOS_G4532.1